MWFRRTIYQFRKQLGLCFSKRRLLCIFGILFVSYYFGVFTHLAEKDFYSEFSYPLEGDISVYVEQLKKGETPSHTPINEYNYEFISNCKYKCLNDIGNLRVVYIVKSALRHFQNRLAIRSSWGFERRFSDVPIRTVFLVGIEHDNNELQSEIEMESNKFGDIIQATFIDTYFNNTIKTMVGFKWAVNFCKNAKFYFFADDDFYISTRNVLQFLRNPVNYPAYLETPIVSVNDVPNKLKRDLFSQPKNDSIQEVLNVNGRKLHQVLDFNLPENVKLFSGYVFVSSPHRHQSSKWYIPLSEYQFHKWPPYVTAGAYVVSKEALLDLYYGSMYTKHFRFDDIYLGLVAYKINVEPFHCDEFHFYKKDYSVHGYHYVIASHGYNDPNELLEVWNQQRSAGNA